jgi:predicted amidophosphoribosyltransferase
MCQICGRPFAQAIAAQTVPSLCRQCRARFFGFDWARSYANYNDALGKAIVLLKYEEVMPLGGDLPNGLRKLSAAMPKPSGRMWLFPFHCIQTASARGDTTRRNPSRPLAGMLGVRLGPYLPVWKKPRPAKLVLSRTERWASARGAYAKRECVEVDNLCVLLVDDVLTTGATLDAFSRALKKAGAAEAYALTVGRVVSSRAPTGPAPRRSTDSGEGNHRDAKSILRS